MEWSIYSLFLPFLCGIAGGICGHALFRSYLHRITLDLDYRLSDLEGRVNREVKIRAGTEVQKKKRADEDIAEAIIRAQKSGNAGPGAPQNLSAWIQSKYKQAH